MATYKEAVHWVAYEDAPADARPDMDLDESVDMLAGNMTVTLISDIWHKTTRQVAVDVLKVRGFLFPRGYQSKRVGQASGLPFAAKEKFN